MASLKELRNRIASVKATQKITKAMQMVAAAKLRRAQEAVEAARPYSQRMGAMLAKLASSGETADNPGAPALLAGTGRQDTHLLLVCTAERGLCGGFNAAIAKAVRAQIAMLTNGGKTVKIFCVGKKGHDALKRSFGDRIIARRELRGVKSVGLAHAGDIAAEVLALFDDGAFDVCTLFYSRFESVMTQTPCQQQLIPAQIAPAAAGDNAAAEPAFTDKPESADTAVYDYEPDESEILTALLPRNVTVQILRALLENAASEQGARMTAMDSATRNAGDMIGRLTLSYNRQRQAQITKELIEIISGAEAL